MNVQTTTNNEEFNINFFFKTGIIFALIVLALIVFTVASYFVKTNSVEKVKTKIMTSLQVGTSNIVLTRGDVFDIHFDELIGRSINADDTLSASKIRDYIKHHGILLKNSFSGLPLSKLNDSKEALLILNTNSISFPSATLLVLFAIFVLIVITTLIIVSNLGSFEMKRAYEKSQIVKFENDSLKTEKESIIVKSKIDDIKNNKQEIDNLNSDISNHKKAIENLLEKIDLENQKEHEKQEEKGMFEDEIKRLIKEIETLKNELIELKKTRLDLLSK